METLTKQELVTSLKEFQQEHIVQFYDSLDQTEKSQLLADIKGVDFKQLKQRFETTLEENKVLTKLDSFMKPVPAEMKGSYQSSTPEQLAAYESRGLEAISKGEVAVVLLAGGQGTRLGVSYPKGMYSVGLPSNKTLFQLQAERLRRVQELASRKDTKAVVPWYVMTSENTHEQIKSYFAKNDFFNLDSENVSFFEQGTLPCLTRDGKLLLDQKNKISRAPDGNGGLYKALLEHNVLEDMLKRGIKYVHIYCVDNILIRIADPVFIGFCIEKEANCAAKVVRKVQPDESVGVICQVKDKFQVVEYSEISQETRNMRDENGDLTYNAGNICNHFLTMEFLEDVCRKHEPNLKYHIAEKKINYIDETGVFNKPTSKNGFKLEKFIFDIFQFSEKFALWEVVRRDEFSPLKNGTNEMNDNEVTCRKHMLEQHARWIEKAGFSLEQEDQTTKFEISPLVSYSGEGLDFSEAEKKEIESTIERTELMVLEKAKGDFSLGETVSMSDKYVLLSEKAQIMSFYNEKRR